MHYICTHAAYYAASTASVSLSFGEGLSADIRRHFLGHQGFQNVHVVIRYPGRNAAKILSKSHFFRRISNDKQTTQLIQNLWRLTVDWWLFWLLIQETQTQQDVARQGADLTVLWSSVSRDLIIKSLRVMKVSDAGRVEVSQKSHVGSADCLYLDPRARIIAVHTSRQFTSHHADVSCRRIWRQTPGPHSPQSGGATVSHVWRPGRSTWGLKSSTLCAHEALMSAF